MLMVGVAAAQNAGDKPADDDAAVIAVLDAKLPQLDRDKITLPQAMAYLAQMTSIARGTPMFRDNGLQDVLTFLDLARMMGFTELTISAGQSFAHRIEFK